LKAKCVVVTTLLLLFFHNKTPNFSEPMLTQNADRFPQLPLRLSETI
jgi:hypothetical protein